jgi:hypothetical protein
VQAMPGGSAHAGFTRILHRMKPDELMNEVRQRQAAATAAGAQQHGLGQGQED